MRPRFRQCGAEISGEPKPDEVYPEKDLTEKIIGCAIAVHKELGPGFLELIYENSLSHELRKQGLNLERQVTVKVLYDGVEVGEHRTDLIVERKVVVELKSVEALTDKHVAQLISTLKAFKIKIGLLLNFNESRLVDGLRRVIY